MEAMRDGGPAAAAEAWQKTAEDQKKWRTSTTSSMRRCSPTCNRF